MNKKQYIGTKVKQSGQPFTVKIKTESNGLGVLKVCLVLFIIAMEVAILAVSHLFLLQLFQSLIIVSIALTLITSIHVLSSNYHGQAKATWIFFLMISMGFGVLMYIFSDKRILFANSKKKFIKIMDETKNLQTQSDLTEIDDCDIKTTCTYLNNAGNFKTHLTSKTEYYSSGVSFFDSVLEELKKAKKFIFLEYYIVSNGALLDKVLDILKEKVKSGVDVRMIYDDMGSHGTLKRKTKKEIVRAGIKLESFNRLVPVFNIALNLRDHRKIVVVDGKVGFTGGANLADEYTNEKRMHGYWKDSGVKIEGKATDNLTIAFLTQWKFIRKNEKIDFDLFLNQSEDLEGDGVVVPFVSGPNYPYSISQNVYANQIANAKEKLYIMTPYFVPDETITNLIIDKARAGVDVRIILPDVADKKFVYYVSRNNAEKMISCGVRLYTMTHSFVHSKVVLSENSVIVGSINMDLRSFNQQFESAVFTNDKATLQKVNEDFVYTIAYCQHITKEKMKRNKLGYRMLAGLFNIISPFM